MRGWRSPRAPGWSSVRFAWRSALGHRRGQTLALVAVSSIITACVAFAPVYDRAMQQALVDTLLAQQGAADRVVAVRSDAAVNAIGTTEADEPQQLAALVPDDVSALLGPPVLGRTAVVTPVGGDVPPTGQLVWREGQCEHVRVLDGECPATAGEIMVSEADLGTFGLAVGSSLEVRPAEDGPDVALVVAGTYALDAGSAGSAGSAGWWQGLALLGHASVTMGTDPSATHDAWLTTEETFDGAPVLPAEASQWSAPLPGDTGVDEVLALATRVEDLGRDVRRVGAQGKGPHVVTTVGRVTGELEGQTVLAHRTVPLLLAPMAVLALVVLWLVLGAATEQRRGEVAVARLRGRGPAGAVALLLVELLPVLLTGVVPGVALALLGGVVTRSLLPGRWPVEAGPGFVAAVLLAVAALVLTSTVAAVRVAREPMDALVRSGRTRSGRWTLGAVDAFVLAAVGTGVLAFATGSLTGGFALAGPALLALLVGLALGHLAAPAAGAWGRRLLVRGRLVGGMTMLDLGRRRETRTVIAVVTVASALAVFAVDALVVGDRNRVDAGRHDAGAPVVLAIEGHDLDGVRAALAAADPTGHDATPVVVSREALAVEPDAFRRVAFFPRGGPTDAQWRAIAPPDVAPVTLTGSRVSLTVHPDSRFSSRDVLDADSELQLGLVITTATGVPRRIPLGTAPAAGERARLSATTRACTGGCTLTAIELTAAQGVLVDGRLDLVDLETDGRAVSWGSSADAWNIAETERAVITPLVVDARTLRLQVGIRGFFPVVVTPAWVPASVPALLTTPPADPPVVTGVDGSDRPAKAVGRLTLVPAMPRRAALVDLDAVTRGAEITFDSRLEVWLLDDTTLLGSVRAGLRERGIAVAGERRWSEVRLAYDDAVPRWSLALGAAVAPAVVLVALLVLLVLATIGWRARARDLAILRLHGAGRSTVRRLGLVAQLPAVLLGVVAGVGAGLAGALLAMPDIAFLPSPPTAPVLDTATSWGAVAVAGVACLVVLPVVAALAGRAVAGRADLERVQEDA